MRISDWSSDVCSSDLFDLAAARDAAVKPMGGYSQPDTAVGDFSSAFAAAQVKVDTTYTTPDQSHMMMEPHATTARWDGDRLTVWTSNQMIHWCVRSLAKTLLVPKENIRAVSAFIGGGFVAKLWVEADPVLAALGARAVGRPAKVALARPQALKMGQGQGVASACL